MPRTIDGSINEAEKKWHDPDQVPDNFVAPPPQIKQAASPL
jgi:hypothetical protein